MGALRTFFEDAGGWRWVLGAGGLLGLVSALVAIVAVARSRRQALALAALATALGACTAVAGGVAALNARLATDASISPRLRTVERQRLRRDGYLAAQPPARLALACAALPLALGVFAMFAAARRRATAEALPEADAPAPRPRIALPATMTTGALVAVGFGVAALAEAVPPPNARAENSASVLRDRLRDVQIAPQGDELARACARLEADMGYYRETLDPGRLPDLHVATRRCIEDAIQQAAVGATLAGVHHDLTVLLGSTMAAEEPELYALLEGTAAEVRQIDRINEENEIGR